MACQVVYPVEHIPGQDSLYRRVPRGWLTTAGELHPGVLRVEGDGISADWEKYSSPEESRSRATSPETTGIIGLLTGDVRSVPGLDVLHSPLPENRAHSNVVDGLELTVGQSPRAREVEVRSHVFELCTGWILEPDQH